ncbi:MAG: dTMP kinase [Spirochaetaceae bacterium]|jgi:dTMP kinase|nr:dTMP kinase [Spirochaetaceae bacterium]
MTVLQNFVVFEGGDGSGTSTQLEILKQRFNRNDLPDFPDSRRKVSPRPHSSRQHSPQQTLPRQTLPPLAATFEPTDGPVGRLLREALRGNTPLNRETMARLFSADRAEHLYGENGIVSLTRQEYLVVCDRYKLSSLVYQGIDCGGELPLNLNKDFPAPELLLYFDLDPKIAFERLEKRSQTDIYEHLDFQIKVRGHYLSLLDSCRAEGSRVVVIDASAAIDDVARVVWQNVCMMPIIKKCMF